MPSLKTFSGACLLCAAVHAHGTATYTYTGNPDQSARFPYSLGDRITGSFTLPAPLAANLTNYTFAPLTYTFSDGATYWVNGTFEMEPVPLGKQLFEVSTNASGAIVAWEILLQTSGPASVSLTTEDEGLPGTTFDEGIANAGYGEVAGNPGTWSATVSGTAATAPEPSSLSLLGAGIIGIAVALRRRPSLSLEP